MLFHSLKLLALIIFALRSHLPLLSVSCVLQGVFKFCQLDIYLTDYHFLDTMLIFMLYGWSAIPLMYLLSFLFSKSTSAYIKLVLFNYLSGIFSLLIDTTFQFGKCKGFIRCFLPQKAVINNWEH